MQRSKVNDEKKSTKGVWGFTKIGTQIFIEFLKTLSETISYIFIKLNTNKELELQCMDGNQIILTQFKLFATCFITTPAKVLQDRILCFPLASLQQLMKNIKICSLHQMNWEVSSTRSNKITIITQQCNGKECLFKVQLLPFEFTEFHMIPNESSRRQKLEVSRKELSCLINQMANLSNQVNLQVNPDSLEFEIVDSIESNMFGKIVLKKQKSDCVNTKETIEEHKKGKSKEHKKQEPQHTFATKYIAQMIMKQTDLPQNKTVEVSLGNDLPLQIRQIFADYNPKIVYGLIDFYLAPIVPEK